MVFNDVSKTSGRPSQPSRGKQGDDEGVSRHQHERDSVELYRALFERNLNLSDTRRSWLPTRGPSEARTSAGVASPHPKKKRRNHKSRPKNWFERYEPMKGKKVPDNCTPMEMLFFEKVADKRHCQSGDAVRSRKSLVSGRWDEENGVETAGQAPTSIKRDKRYSEK